MKINYIKRLYALVLAVVMMSAGVCVVYAEEDNADNTYGVYEMNFNNSIGLTKISIDDIDSAVTNQDFASILAVMFGMADSIYAEDSLNNMIGMGYMLNSCGFPKREIKYSQAVKALVSALGYDLYAKTFGGYPNGYLAAASRYGITKNVSMLNDSLLTNRELCVLVYNTLHANVVVQTKYGMKPSYDDSNTVIEYYLDIKTDYGDVTGNEYTSIQGRSKYNKNRFEINNNVFYAKNDYNDLLGYNIKYYYRDKDLDTPELLYAEPSKKNDVLTLFADDEVAYSDKKIKYVSKNKNISADLSDSYVVIYNGVAAVHGLDYYTDKLCDGVTLIDKDNNGRYDMVKITYYNTMHVGSVSADTYSLYDKNDNSNSILLESAMRNGICKYFDETGAEADFDKITADCAVSAALSEDGLTAVVYISKKQVKGIAEEIDLSAGNESVTVEKTLYEADRSLVKYLNKLQSGSEYIFYLGIDGKLVGYTLSSTEYMPALIVGNKVDLSKDVDSTLTIKLFSDDKTIKIYGFAKRTIVDGITYKTPESIKESLFEGNGALKSRLIRYKLNSDGLIFNIDTAFYNKKNGAEGPDTLRVVVPKQSLYSLTTVRAFGRMMMYTTATKFFTFFDDDPEEEYGYQIMTSANLENSQYYTVEGYSIDKYATKAEYIIIYKDKATDGKLAEEGQLPMCFFGIDKVLKDGVETNVIMGKDISTNGKLELEIEDLSLFDGIEKGDIVRYAVRTDGVIGDAEKVFDYSEKKYVQAKNPSNSSAQFYWVYGKAWASDTSNFVTVYLGDESLIESAELEKCITVSFGTKTPGVYIYDTSTSNDNAIITKTDLGEINNFVNTNNGCDTVLIFSRRSKNSLIMLVR